MEIIDVLKPDGTPTGVKKPKPLVHRDGDWHRAVHIWIVGSDGRVVVQLRSHRKENNPNLWDVSAAGHISSGEDMREAAVREVREELGLEIGVAELRHVATLREQSVINAGTYIDNEIHEIFVVRRDVDLRSLRLQEEEVDAVRLVTFDEFRSLARVPHPEEYALIERVGSGL